MNKKEFSKPLSIEEIKSPTINIPMPPPIPSLADATALMVNGTLSSEITIPTISIPLPRPIPIADLIDHKFISSLMESKKNNNNKTDRDNTLRLPDELIVLITFYFTHVDMAHFRNTSHASEDLNLSRSLAMIPIRIPPDKRADLVFVLNLIRCRNNLLWKMNKKKFSKPLSIEIKSPTINISMPRPIPIANLIDHKFISSLMESKKNKNKTDSKKSYCLVM